MTTTQPKSMYPVNTRKDSPDGKPRVYGVIDIASLGDEFGDLIWSGKKPFPSIGDKITANINKLGSGTVVAYFSEAGYLGVEVALDNRPDWHIKQNGPSKPNALIFGIEVN